MNKDQVIAKIGKKNWKSFTYFMRGQTVGLNTDGSINYYEHDVERFNSIPLSREEISDIIDHYFVTKSKKRRKA